MKTNTMLNRLAELFETHLMGDDAMNDSEVVVSSLSVNHGTMTLTLEGNDSTVKTFLIEEV